MEQKIEQFINDLELLDNSKALIVKELYKLFKKCKEDLGEKFIYGGIGMYIGNRLIGGIWVSRYHTSLVFSRGNELRDEAKVLEGIGKFRRHIKIVNFEDIENKKCASYILQNIKLESKNG